MNLQAIDKWHRTRTGHIVFGLAEFVLAYIFASLAIDSGSLWQYAAAVILLVGGIQNTVKIFILPKNERAKR
jgi:hypothetical protein